MCRLSITKISTCFLNKQQCGRVVCTVTVIDMVLVQNFLVLCCYVPGKDTIQHFFLLGGLASSHKFQSYL